MRVVRGRCSGSMHISDRWLVIGVARCWMWTILDLAGCARCICQVLDLASCGVCPGILRGVPGAAAWRWMGAKASCRVCQTHLPGAGWAPWHLAGGVRCVSPVLEGGQNDQPTNRPTDQPTEGCGKVKLFGKPHFVGPTSVRKCCGKFLNLPQDSSDTE